MKLVSSSAESRNNFYKILLVADDWIIEWFELEET